MHTLVEHAPPHSFLVDEEVGGSGTKRRINSLGEVITSYSYVLRNPYTSTLSKESWFFGDLTSGESVELLRGKPDGTFLFRFSSIKGCLAVSYVQNGEVRLQQKTKRARGRERKQKQGRRRRRNSI